MGKSVYSSVNSSKPVSLYFVDDLEETMAKSFVRSANLRALIFKSECPEIIQNCQPIFQRLVDPQLRDTLQTDMQILSSLTEDGDADEYDDNTINCNEQTARPIPKDLSTALARFHCELPRTAQFLLRVKINGLVYSPMSILEASRKCMHFTKIGGSESSACTDSNHLSNSCFEFGTDSSCNSRSLTFTTSS